MSDWRAASGLLLEEAVYREEPSFIEIRVCTVIFDVSVNLCVIVTYILMAGEAVKCLVLVKGMPSAD